MAVSLLLASSFTALLLPLFTNWIHVQLTLQPDGILLLVIGSLFLGVVLVAGGYPAFILSGFSPWASLRGKLTTASASGLFLRRGLVVVQFVICQALLVGALVVGKQIRYIQQTDLGFTPDNIVVISLPYDAKQSWQGFKRNLQGLPGVESVSLQYRPPSATVMNGGSFKFAGGDWVKYPVRERLADADYLSTYGFKLMAGRNIAPSDSIREYLINETLARKLGYRNPADVVGKRMQYYLSTAWLPIVGVIRDFHQRSLREAIGPCLITSYPTMYRQVGVRLTGQSTATTLMQIRAVWQRMYPNDVFDYEFLTDQLTQFYEAETTISRLANLFTGLAMLICALGLFGLLSFTVGQRTKEIGVRKVLGASVSSIVVLLSTDFLTLVFIAIVVGSPLAYYGMNRWLANFAYRIEVSWWIFALAGLLAVGIALLTVSFQSIRAALANPVDSLRSD